MGGYRCLPPQGFTATYPHIQCGRRQASPSRLFELNKNETQIYFLQKARGRAVGGVKTKRHDKGKQCEKNDLFHLCLQVVERKPFQTLAHQEHPLEGRPGLVAFVLEHAPHPNVLHTQPHLHPHFCGVRPCRRGPLFRRGVRVPDDLFAGGDGTERIGCRQWGRIIWLLFFFCGAPIPRSAWRFRAFVGPVLSRSWRLMARNAAAGRSRRR